MREHNWEQVGQCLNGPHVWRCQNCHEWTRSYDKPDPNCDLIDPDNGERYGSRPNECPSGTEPTPLDEAGLMELRQLVGKIGIRGAAIKLGRSIYWVLRQITRDLFPRR